MPKTAATEITDPAVTTPAVIDTEIARLMAEEARLQADVDRWASQRKRADQAITDGRAWAWTGMKPIEYTALITDAFEQQRQLMDQMAPLRAEYVRRPWTRYYLVDAHNGHVHSSMSCTSCFPTTAYYWLTSESGKTAEQVVAEAQSQACTVCFPWAPVTDKRGSYRTPTQAEAEQRAAERAAKAAAKKAAEITAPDGGELYAAEVKPGGGFWRGDRLRTEASAWRHAMDRTDALARYGTDHPDAPGWTETINRCVAALAVRREVTERSLRDQLTTKIAAKAKREGWTIQG